MFERLRCRIRALLSSFFRNNFFQVRASRCEAEARRAEQQKSAVALGEALASAAGRRDVLDTVMEYLPMGITIADAPYGSIRAVSRHGRELLGKSSEQLTNISPVEQ